MSATQLTAEFLSEKIGHAVVSVTPRDQQKMGGMSADMRFIDVKMDDAESIAMVVKTAAPGDELKIAIGAAREALFYSEFASQLADAGVPRCDERSHHHPHHPPHLCRCYYAEGDMTTGEMLVLIECAEGAVPAGTFFGPENPNNWAVKDKLEGMCEGNPTAEQISADAFNLYARLHAKYWQDDHLVKKEWLKGSDWQRGSGNATWHASQQMAIGAWAATSKEREEGTSPISWDPHLLACIDTSFGKVDWSHFQTELNSRAFSLVHGDCHPHNALWTRQRTEHAKLCLIDFEMVAVGSPAQDIGQWMVSHMLPAVRRRCEKDLVMMYHQAVQAELRQLGKDSHAEAFTFELCWLEYVSGAAARWIWLLAVLVSRVPPSMGQYFHDQVAAFLHDHIKNPVDAPMPRV